MITDADRSACGGADPAGFPDVTGGVHAGNIECVAGYGIALGFRDGTYGPLRDVRRDQMASFIARMLRSGGVDLPASPPDAFDDDDGSTHELAINQLAALGIVQGRGAGVYAPLDEVTRAQMASFVVRAVEYALGEDLPSPRSPFTDVPSGGPHTSNIDAAYAAGIVQGVTSTTYAPNEDVRRDQMASFIARSMEVVFRAYVDFEPLD
jgi:hypothetical protein